jgi:hypothetical protein
MGFLVGVVVIWFAWFAERRIAARIDESAAEIADSVVVADAG